MSPKHVCLDGSKAKCEGGAMLLCLSMAKKTKVKHTCTEGLRGGDKENQTIKYVEKYGETSWGGGGSSWRCRLL